MSASELKASRPFIWINGFPGTGKHTIAKLLATLLDGDPVVIDNHSLIDPVAKKFSRDHPSYQQARRQEREAVFKKLAEDITFRSRIVIFTGERKQPHLTFVVPISNFASRLITDFQSDDEIGSSVAREYKAAALRAGRTFLPIYLECDIEENKRRIASSQRKSGGTTKLLDPDTLAGMRARCKLFRFDGVKAITCDVTDMGSNEAAEVLERDLMEIWKRGS